VVLSYQTSHHSVTDLAAGFAGLLSAVICMFADEYSEIGDLDMVILNHP
jgi:hypothetical protein